MEGVFGDEPVFRRAVLVKLRIHFVLWNPVTLWDESHGGVRAISARLSAYHEDGEVVPKDVEQDLQKNNEADIVSR